MSSIVSSLSCAPAARAHTSDTKTATETALRKCNIKRSCLNKRMGSSGLLAVSYEQKTDAGRCRRDGDVSRPRPANGSQLLSRPRRQTLNHRRERGEQRGGDDGDERDDAEE